MMRKLNSHKGFIVPMALIVLTIAGILFFSLNAMSRQRNRTAHRYSNLKITDALANAGIEVISTRFSEAVKYSFSNQFAYNFPLDQSKHLVDFMCQSIEDLERNGTMDAQEFDTWAQEVFGKCYRGSLAILEQEHPGSSIDISITCDCEPILEEPFHDPVQKIVNLGITARAEYRSVVSEVSIVLPFRVYNTLAPMVSKFTLFVDEAETGNAYNILRADPKGMPLPDQPMAAFICYNTPAPVVSDYELTEDNIDNIKNKTPFANNDDILASVEQRGYIYMGSTGEDITLNLTAGESLDDNLSPVLENEQGEFFHFVNPITRNSVPAHYIKMDVPSFFQSSYLAPPPNDEMIRQQPYIAELFWGYHHPYIDGSSSLRAQDIFGSALDTESSSILHLFGNDNEPSRTRVYGPVYQSYIQFGYLAIDRAEGNSDENTQLSNYNGSGAAPGFFIPIRETIDPPLKFIATDSEFNDELSREASGQPFERLIAPFPLMTNQNFFADMNLNGVRDLSNPYEPIIDPEFPTVSIDPAVYTYANMFGSYRENEVDGYHNAMSNTINVPYVEMADYMVYAQTIPPKKHSSYPGLAIGGDVAEYIEPGEFSLSYNDPLHEEIDDKEHFTGEMQDVIDKGHLEKALLSMAQFSALEQSDFYEMFPLVPNADEDLPPGLVCDAGVVIEKGSLTIPTCNFSGKALIIVKEGDLILESVSCFSDIPTFVALNGDIIFSAGGNFNGEFIAPKGRIQTSGSPVYITGNIVSRQLLPSSLSAGGSVRFTGVTDPTCHHADGQSYIDYYKLSFSDMFTHYVRKSGIK